jgi:hypothetical protein
MSRRINGIRGATALGFRLAKDFVQLRILPDMAKNPGLSNSV